MILIFLSIFFTLFTHNSLATGDFSVNQHTIYTIDQNGNAYVTENFEITNLLSQVYLKEYVIKIERSDISQITAHDKNGNILKSVNKSDQNTSINLNFSQPQIGRGKKNQFTIYYSINNYTVNKGKTWEIQLPTYQNNLNEQLIVDLVVPRMFGELSFSTVPATQTPVQEDKYLISLNYQQIKPSKKILIIFGNHQLFNFELKYFLNNPSSSPINTEIAFPPDTNTQKIIFESINPAPIQISTDSDGNWLGQYNLPPQTKIEIIAKGQAKIFPLLNKSQTIDTSSYLKPKQYWPIDTPQIINTASRFSDIKQIYDFTVNYLNYDYSNLNQATRQGALSALDNPSKALCTEFTDLFVSLARAKSIPAREIQGYAYTNNPKIKPLNPNSDILHAWPQYYDFEKQNWISVDPTWEKTTSGIDYFTDLDLNHFTFVIHGNDSIYPSPAGSYRLDTNQKTVAVDFADDLIQINLIPPVISFQNNQITVYNPNLASLNQVNINIPSHQWSQPVESIPPLGKVSYPYPKNNRNLQVSLSCDEFETFTTNINQSKITLSNPFVIISLITLLSILGIIISLLPKKT